MKSFHFSPSLATPEGRVVLGLDQVQVKLAARAGMTTLLASWLNLALFLSPYWAAQTNYPGHQHPIGTLPHTHNIQAVVGYALVMSVVVAVLLALRPVWSFAPEPVLWLELIYPARLIRQATALSSEAQSAQQPDHSSP